MVRIADLKTACSPLRGALLAMSFMSFVAILYSCGYSPMPPRIRYLDANRNNDSPPLLEPAKDWYMVLYYPYIEEVIFPDPVYESEPFEIHLRLSAEYRPSVLQGYPYSRKHPDDGDASIEPDEFMVAPKPPGTDYDGEIGLDQYIIGSYLSGVGESIGYFVYKFPSGLPAGKYLVKTGTVRERRAGGAGVIIGEDLMTVGGDDIFFEVGTRMLELELVVLPAEGGGEQA